MSESKINTKRFPAQLHCAFPEDDARLDLIFKWLEKQIIQESLPITVKKTALDVKVSSQDALEHINEDDIALMITNHMTIYQCKSTREILGKKTKKDPILSYSQLEVED